MRNSCTNHHLYFINLGFFKIKKCLLDYLMVNQFDLELHSLYKESMSNSIFSSE